MTIDEKYERELVKKQAELRARIESLYQKFVTEIAPILAGTMEKRAMQRAITAALRELSRSVRGEIVSGIIQSWELSNLKNVAYLDKRLKGLADQIPNEVKKVWYDPNTGARDAFLKRERNGLNLSNRIHKSTVLARRSIDRVLKEGIGEGKSSVKIARQLRTTLRDPKENPISNTMRVARTETNMAYRMSDHESWKNDPAIMGYEVQLSATQSKKVKARCEICRALAGKYPVSFVFAGWHPNCLCFMTPIEMTDAQFARYTKLLARGEAKGEALEAVRQSSRLVKDVPAGFKKWVRDNQERVEGWKSRPYWWGENNRFLEGVLKS